ncbi:MAG: hypothetical protein WBA10_00055, partial [Elainellaceae cyanobacterium]
MRQITRWDLCRFVKTLAYFGVVPFLGSAGWLQQMLGLSTPPSDDGSIAMITNRPVLVVAEGDAAEGATAALDQVLTQQGYQAHSLQ